MRAKIHRFFGVLAVVAIIAGPPLALWAMGLTPQWVWQTITDVSTMTMTVDTVIVMALLGLLGWLGWIWFAVGALCEVLAHFSGRTWTVPGFTVPQHMVRKLLTAGVIASVAVPVLGATAQAATEPVSTSSSVGVVSEKAEGPAAIPQSGPTQPVSQEITVQAGDTLWALAEQHLGDGMRWSQLYEANTSQIHDPDLLEIGMRLSLPAHSTPTPVITEEIPIIAPKGEYPTVGQPVEKQPEHSVGQSPKAAESTPTAQPTPEQMSTPAPAKSATEHNRVPAPVVQAPDAVESENTAQVASDVDLLPVLTTAAGSVLLIGGLWALYRRLRARQMRRRIPGTAIAPTPERLTPAENQLAQAGTPHMDDSPLLDRVLRHLHSAASPFPSVLGLMVEDDLIKMQVLHNSAPPPEPWSTDESGHWWTLPTITNVPDLPFVAAPLPCLVTVGHTAEGHRWMIDLEVNGIVHVHSAPEDNHEKAHNLVRHIVAELATNAHTDFLSVVLVGWGAELAALNPDRVQAFDTVADAAEEFSQIARDAARTPADLQTARLAGDSEYTRPTVVVVNGADAQAPQVAPLTDFFAETDLMRTCMGLVVVGDASIHADLDVAVGTDGVVHLAESGVTVTAAAMPAQESQVVTTLIQAAYEDQFTDPVPAEPVSGRPWESLVNADGSLRYELTKNTAGADPASILPKPTAEYVKTKAAVPEDIDRLGKAATPETVELAQAADPTLDDDLTAWHTESVPTLRILGPMRLSVPDAPTPKREKYLTEIAGLLAAHPAGLTLTELANALGIAKESAKEGARLLRRHLGTKPDGTEWLPAASEQHRDGVNVYRLDGVLVDADLVKRLRLRSQTQESCADADLADALALVSGMPLTPPQGYSPKWVDTTRHQAHLVAMVHDLAHLAVLRALSAQENTKAANIAERIADLIPGDTVHLDVIAAEAGEFPALAAQRAHEDVVHAGNPSALPDDATERAQHLLQQNFSPSGAR